jgi:hypothetical protein
MGSTDIRYWLTQIAKLGKKLNGKSEQPPRIFRSATGSAINFTVIAFTKE